MSIVIKAENISKAYQLGQIGTGTVSRDIERWVAKLRGKEDPFLKIGEANDRATKGTSDIVWSLKDINFEINQGDAVGIIGRNGAGKSTLLKLLSRVTAPTTGNIKVKGRIASLLEVGTGFHPELTGRENIYLNGAILGMRKKEITRKFDEIVDFSGVERYIDTPVKRYSSGMYVRLAFAVAAHLESEILVVDEVLAVGDAEFQSKCLGKMGDVSKGEGRTILFVSHNMAAITTLCNHSVVLKYGMIDFVGSVGEGVEKYIKSSKLAEGIANFENIKHHKCLFSRLISIELLNADNKKSSVFFIGSKMKVRICFELKESISNLEIGFCVNNLYSQILVGYVSVWDGFKKRFEQGVHTVECEIPFLKTLPNSYTITVWVKRVGELIDDQIDEAISFEVLSQELNSSNPYFEKYAQLQTYQPSTWYSI